MSGGVVVTQERPKLASLSSIVHRSCKRQLLLKGQEKEEQQFKAIPVPNLQSQLLVSSLLHYNLRLRFWI